MAILRSVKAERMASDTSTTTLLPLPKSRKRSRPSDKGSNEGSSKSLKASTKASSIDTHKTDSKISVVEKLIRGHYDGHIEDPALRNLDWYRAIVPPAEFVALIQAFDDKLRQWITEFLTYDWIATTGEIILRKMMPNPVHDVVAAEIGLAFYDQLRDLLKDRRTSSKVKELVKDIDGPYPNLAANIRATAGGADDDTNDDPLLISKRHPDNCFCFSTRGPMPIVIEVGNSQKSKDLEELAKSWMKENSRKTKTVITVDLDYQDRLARKQTPNTPKATITLYRVNISRSLKTRFVFHDSSAAEENEQDLELTLADFLPRDTVEETKKSSRDFKFPALVITAEKLRDILAKADKIQQVRDRDSRSRSPENASLREEDGSKKKLRKSNKKTKKPAIIGA